MYVVVTSTRPYNEVRSDLSASYGARIAVNDSGQGTVEDPSALWFELGRKGLKEGLPTVEIVREALTSAEQIRAFQQVAEGTGKDLARQIPLLAGCSGGLWKAGLPGGPVAKELEPEVKKERPKDSGQMPLFDEM